MAKDTRPRLRGRRLERPPHIVLVDPEIPQNTGNIGRLAAALGCPLHLVGRLGFRIDERAVRRAGLDYWHLVEVHRHLDLAHFCNEHPHARLMLFSSVAPRSFYEARFQPGDALVFGSESVGLPEEVLEAHAERCFALPTVGEVRSLNVANAATVVAYEACRQLGAFDELSLRFSGSSPDGSSG
jgi:tRNA (cytidine/uridine-2'-O-)-methyltransferase